MLLIIWERAKSPISARLGLLLTVLVVFHISTDLFHWTSLVCCNLANDGPMMNIVEAGNRHCPHHILRPTSTVLSTPGSEL